MDTYYSVGIRGCSIAGYDEEDRFAACLKGDNQRSWDRSMGVRSRGGAKEVGRKGEEL